MRLLWDIAIASWEVFLVASPFILLGLAGAGLLHVLIRPERIARWLGRPGLGSTSAAALAGIPLPLCSCSVVPVTIELSRKGASREASLAFLVSTPETGVDSILVTWALMGPVMAVARPVAALVTGLVAGAVSMLWRASPAPGEKPAEAPPSPAPAADPPPTSAISRWRDGLRYAFVVMVDEIGFWLVAGILLTGVITALVPDDLLGASLGRGPLAMLALLVFGVPLYMCASASTPVAAALMLKGVSPGAALVFLLAGPATNASSLVVIGRFFGQQFIKIYLASVVAVALAAGLGLDLLLGALGWTLVPTLSPAGMDGEGWVLPASAAALALLLSWSALKGAWGRALADLTRDLRKWSRVMTGRVG